MSTIKKAKEIKLEVKNRGLADIDKLEKIELIERSLGIRHKIKVQETMKQPETHEDLAVMLLAKWEYEDELRAIEEILAQTRHLAVDNKKQEILKGQMPKIIRKF